MPPLPLLAAVAALAALTAAAGASALVTSPSAPRHTVTRPPAARPYGVAASANSVAPGGLGSSSDGRPPRSSSTRTGYRWPLDPRPVVLRRFAVGPHPWSPGHRGVDLAAAAGDPVLAAGPGIVAFAGTVAGRGVVSVLHPDGIRTTYEPVSATVAAGDAVTAGEPIGDLTAGPHCPGSCLHWGALRGDTYLDPLSLLAPQPPPVLLPLGGASSIS